MANGPWMHLVLLSCRLPHCCVLYLAYKYLMNTPASKSEMKQSRTLYRDAGEMTASRLTCRTSWCHRQWPLCRHPAHDRVILQRWRDCAASAAQPWQIRCSTIWTHNMLILQISYKIQSINIEAIHLNNWEHHNAIFPNEDIDVFMTNDRIIITINPT